MTIYWTVLPTNTISEPAAPNLQEHFVVQLWLRKARKYEDPLQAVSALANKDSKLLCGFREDQGSRTLIAAKNLQSRLQLCAHQLSGAALEIAGVRSSDVRAIQKETLADNVQTQTERGHRLLVLRCPTAKKQFAVLCAVAAQAPLEESQVLKNTLFNFSFFVRELSQGECYYLLRDEIMKQCFGLLL